MSVLQHHDSHDRVYPSVYQYLVGLLIETNRRHRAAAESIVNEIGLHRSQHHLLMYLSQHDQLLSQKQIADDFQISPAAVATGLKKLEREGYILRCINPGDNRYNTIRITAKGLAVVNQSKESFEAIDRAMFHGLTDEEISQYTRLMTKLQNNLSTFRK